MAKGSVAKKSGAKKAGSKRGGKAKGNRTRRTFTSFINRINKNAKHTQGLSSKAAKVLNSFAQDMLEKIGDQAASLCRATRSSTMKAAQVQAAVRMTLPADLAKHCISEASKAVSAYAKATPAAGKKKVAKK